MWCVVYRSAPPCVSFFLAVPGMLDSQSFTSLRRTAALSRNAAGAVQISYRYHTEKSEHSESSIIIWSLATFSDVTSSTKFPFNVYKVSVHRLQNFHSSSTKFRMTFPELLAKNAAGNPRGGWFHRISVTPVIAFFSFCSSNPRISPEVRQYARTSNT